jgi:Cytochrome P460
MMPPADYRDWVFLSSGVDMSYSEHPAMADAHVFDNVFVPLAAYAAFKRTGVWPDKTVLMLENHGAKSKGSINRPGTVPDQRDHGSRSSCEGHGAL